MKAESSARRREAHIQLLVATERTVRARQVNMNIWKSRAEQFRKPQSRSKKEGRGAEAERKTRTSTTDKLKYKCQLVSESRHDFSSVYSNEGVFVICLTTVNLFSKHLLKAAMAAFISQAQCCSLVSPPSIIILIWVCCTSYCYWQLVRERRWENSFHVHIVFLTVTHLTC